MARRFSRRLSRLSLVVAFLVCALASAGQTVELDPKILTFQTPQQFKWRDPFNKSPSNAVALHGDGVNGFYVASPSGTRAAISAVRTPTPTTG